MMSSKLESENRTKKAIEMNAKRQIEDAKRKLELENSRKVRELEEKSKARKAAQEEKMKQLKVNIFIFSKFTIFIEHSLPKRTKNSSGQHPWRYKHDGLPAAFGRS